MLSLEPGRAVVYDEPLKLERAARRPDLLSRAVRQDRRRGLPGRQAAPARQEHDLRRHPRRSCCRSISARWRTRSRKQLGKKPKAMQLNMGALEAGKKYAAEHLDEARSVPRRADEQDRRPDSGRRQRRGRDGLHVRRRHRRRLVSDHAVVVAARDADQLHAEVPHGQGDRQGDVRDRPGRGRNRGDRHGRRRELGGRAGDDVDVRARASR